MNDKQVLEFTGERFTPECVGEIWLEHWHRYLFAERFSSDKEVLDLACGEGYGSHVLASRAKRVVGMDVSDKAVQHARSRYGQDSALEFLVGDGQSLPFDDASFDLVVSFETIEHVTEQESFIKEFRRVLRPDGMLIISSPNRKTYSDDRNYQNEFHVKEFYRSEFEDFLTRHFPFVRLCGQKITMNSLIWPEGVRSENVTVAIQGQKYENLIPYDPLYFVAVCTAKAVELPISVLGEADEWLLHHYEEAMRKLIRLDREWHEQRSHLHDLGMELSAVRQELAETLSRQSSDPNLGLPVWLQKLVRLIRGKG